MTSSPIIVRAMASDAERERHIQASVREFSQDSPPDAVSFFKSYVTTRPDYRPQIMRGAYIEGEQVGGYILFEWVMRMGEARIPTGCIGDVVTYPGQRQKGIASALMYDAITYAQQEGFPLLLLDGIPKFYHRYGYARILDSSVHDIDRLAIQAQPASTHSVRPATIEDASAILALYEKHYGCYTGSFAHTLEQQRHWLERRVRNAPVLAIGPEGQIEGYLVGARVATSNEMTADNWPAALALFQYHARQVDESETPAVLHYRLPVGSPIIQWAIDMLQVVDTSKWGDPTTEGSVISHTFGHPNTGWMARIVDLSALIRVILPELQARWKRSMIHWSGKIAMLVEDEQWTIRIDGSDLDVIEGSEDAHGSIFLTPQEFTRALFGYRRIGVTSSELQTVLDAIFPGNHFWIPGSDWF